MQITQFPKIVAFVEGTAERIFINNNFHYVDLVPLGNGVSWTVDAMCEQVRTKFAAKNVMPDIVLVWFDREKRKETSAHISEQVSLVLKKQGVAEERIHCLIPDMMTENLILADEELISSELNLPDYKYEFEGHHGKAVLERLFVQADRRYKSGSHGHLLLKKIRVANAAERSPSVAAFYSRFPIDCWWLSKGESVKQAD